MIEVGAGVDGPVERGRVEPEVFRQFRRVLKAVLRSIARGHHDRVSALGANVEDLELTGTAKLNGTGNTGNNGMTGNSGNNKLSGLGGNDLIMAASSANVSPGAGADRVVNPQELGAARMASFVARPHVAEQRDRGIHARHRACRSRRGETGDQSGSPD